MGHQLYEPPKTASEPPQWDSLLKVWAWVTALAVMTLPAIAIPAFFVVFGEPVGVSNIVIAVFIGLSCIIELYAAMYLYDRLNGSKKPFTQVVWDAAGCVRNAFVPSVIYAVTIYVIDSLLDLLILGAGGVVFSNWTLTTLLSLALAIYVGNRFSAMYFILAIESKPGLQALRESWSRTSGIGLRMFAYMMPAFVVLATMLWLAHDVFAIVNSHYDVLWFSADSFFITPNFFHMWNGVFVLAWVWQMAFGAVFYQRYLKQEPSNQKTSDEKTSD